MTDDNKTSTENKTEDKVNIGLITKLYSVNSVITDNMLKYGSKITSSTFDLIRSGSVFVTGTVNSTYNKLYDMTKGTNITPKEELDESIPDSKKTS